MMLHQKGVATPVKTVSEAVAIVTGGDTKKVFAIDYNKDGSAFITLKDGEVARVTVE